MIGPETIEELAGLFERFNDAFDPESADAKEAEAEFDRKAEQLHASAVEQGFDLPLFKFKSHLRYRCRLFLSKN